MDFASHPSRVRELKQVNGSECRATLVSHPSRVRELKRNKYINSIQIGFSRTPPGCVN